jgi:hypothetical protein
MYRKDVHQRVIVKYGDLKVVERADIFCYTDTPLSCLYILVHKKYNPIFILQ